MMETFNRDKPSVFCSLLINLYFLKVVRNIFKIKMVYLVCQNPYEKFQYFHLKVCLKLHRHKLNVNRYSKGCILNLQPFFHSRLIWWNNYQESLIKSSAVCILLNFVSEDLLSYSNKINFFVHLIRKTTPLIVEIGNFSLFFYPKYF